uniref:Genome polyprotein n=1 Tax=Perinereis aibuhitensis picorna-like virus 3 TaxID=3237980 RepID=A0AB39A386_9PICO
MESTAEAAKKAANAAIEDRRPTIFPFGGENNTIWTTIVSHFGLRIDENSWHDGPSNAATWFHQVNLNIKGKTKIFVSEGLPQKAPAVVDARVKCMNYMLLKQPTLVTIPDWFGYLDQLVRGNGLKITHAISGSNRDFSGSLEIWTDYWRLKASGRGSTKSALENELAFQIASKMSELDMIPLDLPSLAGGEFSEQGLFGGFMSKLFGEEKEPEKKEEQPSTSQEAEDAKTESLKEEVEKPRGFFKKIFSSVRENLCSLLGVDRFNTIIGAVEGILSKVSDAFEYVTEGLRKIRTSVLLGLAALASIFVVWMLGLIPFKGFLNYIDMAFKSVGFEVPEEFRFWVENTTPSVFLKFNKMSWERARSTTLLWAEDPKNVGHELVVVNLTKALETAEDLPLIDYLATMITNSYPDKAKCFSRILRTVVGSCPELDAGIRDQLFIDLMTSYNEWLTAARAATNNNFMEIPRWQAFDTHGVIVPGVDAYKTPAGQEQACNPVPFIVGLVGTYMMGGWPSDTREVVKSVTSVTALTTFVANSKSVVEWFIAFLPASIRAWFDHMYIQESDNQNLTAWLRKCTTIRKYTKCQTIVETDSYIEKVNSALAEGTEYLINTKDSTMRHAIVTNYMALSGIASKAVQFKSTNLVRRPPFVVWLYGKSSMGKTELAPRWLKDIFNIEQAKTGVVSGATKHWDGYNFSARAIIMNEALMSQDPEGSTITAWLELCSSAKFSPPMAQVDSKGNSIEPEVVIATSNYGYPKVSADADKTAVYRRRNLVIEMGLVEGTPMKNRLPDFTRMDAKTKEEYRYAKFRFHSPTDEGIGHVVSEWMTHQEVVKKIRQHHKAYVKDWEAMRMCKEKKPQEEFESEFLRAIAPPKGKEQGKPKKKKNKHVIKAGQLQLVDPDLELSISEDDASAPTGNRKVRPAQQAAPSPPHPPPQATGTPDQSDHEEDGDTTPEDWDGLGKVFTAPPNDVNGPSISDISDDDEGVTAECVKCNVKYTITDERHVCRCYCGAEVDIGYTKCKSCKCVFRGCDQPRKLNSICCIKHVDKVCTARNCDDYRYKDGYCQRHYDILNPPKQTTAQNYSRAVDLENTVTRLVEQNAAMMEQMNLLTKKLLESEKRQTYARATKRRGRRSSASSYASAKESASESDEEKEPEEEKHKEPEIVIDWIAEQSATNLFMSALGIVAIIAAYRALKGVLSMIFGTTRADEFDFTLVGEEQSSANRLDGSRRKNNRSRSVRRPGFGQAPVGVENKNHKLPEYYGVARFSDKQEWPVLLHKTGFVCDAHLFMTNKITDNGVSWVEKEKEVQLTYQYLGKDVTVDINIEGRVTSIDNSDIAYVDLTTEPRYRFDYDLAKKLISMGELRRITRSSFFARFEERSGMITDITCTVGVYTVKYSNGKKVTLNDVIRYKTIRAQPGACGSLVVATLAPHEGKILGLHSYGGLQHDGNTIGGACMMSREEFLEMSKPPVGTFETIDIDPEGECQGLADTSIYGKFKTGEILCEDNILAVEFRPREEVNIPSKTAYVKSDFPEIMGPLDMKPAAMTCEEVESGEDPGMIMLQKFASVKRQDPPDPKLLTRIKDELINELQDTMSFKTKRTLKPVEVVNGLKYLSSMDMSTNPGWPYNFEHLTKADLVNPTGSIHKRLWCLIQRMKAQAEYDGIIDIEKSELKWTMYLKDELRTTEKAKTGQTRCIFAGPLHLWWVMREMTGGFSEAFLLSWPDLESAVGSNPNSLDMTTIMAPIQNCGQPIWDGDFAGWDYKMPREIIKVAYEIVGAMCKRNVAGFDERLYNCVVDAILRMPIKYKHFDVYLNDGQRSGAPVTTSINCLCNSIIFRLAFYTTNKERYFTEHVALRNYGDDNIWSCDPEIFNPMDMAKYCKSIGLDYTTADKEPYRNAEPSKNPQFLSRELADYSVDCIVGSPMIKTMQKLLYWKRKDVPLSEYIDVSLQFASLRDVEFFYKIKDAWKSLGYESQVYKKHYNYIRKKSAIETTARVMKPFEKAPVGMEQGLPKKDITPHSKKMMSVDGAAGLSQGLVGFKETQPPIIVKDPIRKMVSIEAEIADLGGKLDTGLRSSIYRKSATWSSGDNVGKEIMNFQVPIELIKDRAKCYNALQNMPFEHYLYNRVETDVEFVTTGTGFQTGFMILYNSPVTGHKSPSGWETSYQHSFIDPGIPARTVLAVPYTWDKIFTSMHEAQGSREENYSRVRLQVGGRLNTGDIEVAVFSRFDKPQFLGVPRPPWDGPPEAPTGVEQGLLDYIPEGVEQGNSSSTKIENHYELKNSVIGELQPNFELDTDATQTISPEVSTSVEPPMMDKKRLAGGSVPVYVQYPGMSKSSGVDPTIVMGLNQAANRKTKPRTYGTTADELNVTSLTIRPTLLKTWDWTAASERRFVHMLLSPMMQSSNPELGLLFTLCEYICRNFTQWKGNFTLHLRIPSNSQCTGKIQTTMLYGTNSAPDDVRCLAEQFMEIVDISGGKQVHTIEIPFFAATEWLKVRRNGRDTVFSEDYIMGSLIFDILQKFASTNDKIGGTEISLWFSADLRLATPSPIAQYGGDTTVFYDGPAPEGEEQGLTDDLINKAKEGATNYIADKTKELLKPTPGEAHTAVEPPDDDTPPAENAEEAADRLEQGDGPVNEHGDVSNVTTQSGIVRYPAKKMVQMDFGALFEYPASSLLDIARRAKRLPSRMVQYTDVQVTKVGRTTTFKGKVLAIDVKPTSESANLMTGWKGDICFFIKANMRGFTLVYHCAEYSDEETLNGHPTDVILAATYLYPHSQPGPDVYKVKAHNDVFDVKYDDPPQWAVEEALEDYIKVTIPFENHREFLKVTERVGKLMIVGREGQEFWIYNHAGDDFQPGIYGPHNNIKDTADMRGVTANACGFNNYIPGRRLNKPKNK